MTTPSPRSFRIGRSATGLGLFATSAIQKGEFIVDYVGPRISNAEAAQRSRARYLFELNSRWTIDGSPRWNIGRYANHACRPNAEAIASKGKIRIVAKKRIRPGEEITFHYGKSYFDAFILPRGCKCKTCVEREVRVTKRAISA